jgi:hypothetical protein
MTAREVLNLLAHGPLDAEIQLRIVTEDMGELTVPLTAITIVRTEQLGFSADAVHAVETKNQTTRVYLAGEE